MRRPALAPNFLLAAFFVPLLFVLFHDGSRRNLFGAAPISATFLRTFFDVFVLTLLFVADATQMVISRHIDPPVGIQQARYQANQHASLIALERPPVAAQLGQAHTEP